MLEPTMYLVISRHGFTRPADLDTSREAAQALAQQSNELCYIYKLIQCQVVKPPLPAGCTEIKYEEKNVEVDSGLVVASATPEAG